MKKFRNILFLSAILSGIIFIWLIPKTNGEKKTQYVRVYTKEREQATEADSGKTDKSAKEAKKENKFTEKAKSKREVIKIDTLNGTLEMEDIQPSLYSRSMHFKRVKTIEPELDSNRITILDSANSSAMRPIE